MAVLVEGLLEELLRFILARPIGGVLLLAAILLYLCSTLIGVAPAICALAISAGIGWRFPRHKLISLNLFDQQEKLSFTRPNGVEGMWRTGANIPNLRQLMLEQAGRRPVSLGGPRDEAGEEAGGQGGMVR